MPQPLSRRLLLTLAGGGLVPLAAGAAAQEAAAMRPARAAAGLPVTATTAAPVARRQRVRFGAWQPGPSDAYQALEKDLGRKLDIVHWYQGWGDDDPRFDVARARAVRARGARPMVTWEPWDYRLGRDQPRFRLRHIAEGRFDSLLRSWARSLRGYGHPVLLRLAHEMNATAYPWSVGVNGNTAKDYVAAWRHVVRLMRRHGATNVSFVWCPVVPYAGTAPLARCFPGDRFVDVVGMDGYNAGTAADWGGWLSLPEIFGRLYTQVTRLSSRPVMIAEVGCAEEGGNKAKWLEYAFVHALPRQFPRVTAVVWFNETREADWRLESSPTSLSAARTVFRSGRFAV